MPPKAKMPAPIDRPLSRAYLRAFTGWSTAYPPGVSEPGSQRAMENMLVNREGSIRVRPGLRYLTYQESGPNSMSLFRPIVGSHEVFFLNDGRKAYLFAVRESNGFVTFRVAFDQASDTQPFGTTTLMAPPVAFANNPTPLSVGTTYVKYLQIDNKILALGNNGDTVRIFYVGSTKKVVAPVAITRPFWSYLDKPIVRHPSPASINDPATYPAYSNNSGTNTRTLGFPSASLDDALYNIGYYYTFSNEIGEGLPSQVQVVKVRRRWSAWRWEKASLTKADSTVNNFSEPNGISSPSADLVCDQLIIYPPADAYNQARSEGATHFNVYAIMWSTQDPVPIEGQLIESLPLAGLPVDILQSYVRHSPMPSDNARASSVPTYANRFNYSDPSRAAQGIVAADRMVLVLDPTRSAVIKWTSNQVGEYLNFTANRGGGYKTLTTGNIYVPACVKLWQNPQSADTLTILCLGVDGLSSAFYMAPAQVASQSDATNIMGFEETTATPGTVSPYGCEVLNNALYHPLEDALVKSTASNYNINHKNMTDLIANKWKPLLNKSKIISSFIDNRLYYLVHNPEGAALEANCLGNEVWVVDTAAKDGGAWSRWLVQGVSLRKIEVRGKLMMSLVKPDGIYAFDEDKRDDDYVVAGTAEFRAIAQRPIPWKFETNTQGANRAHDAWAHLQQVTTVLGNFQGTMRFGVRGFDLNGRNIEIAKETKDLRALSTDKLPWDIEDHLLIRRDMKEWRYFAESVVKNGALLPSSGQVSLVQYKYTPLTVNVGYEYGSVETFEYGNVGLAGSTTENGVPQPMMDTTRP